MRTEDEKRCRANFCTRKTKRHTDIDTRRSPRSGTRANAKELSLLHHPQQNNEDGVSFPPLARPVKGLETFALYVHDQERFFQQNGKNHRHQDDLKELRGFLQRQKSLRMLWVISSSSQRLYEVDLCPIIAPLSSISIFFGVHVRFPGGILPQCFSKFRDSLVNFKCLGCGMEAAPIVMRNFSKLQALVFLHHHCYKKCVVLHLRRTLCCNFRKIAVGWSTNGRSECVVPSRVQ